MAKSDRRLLILLGIVLLGFLIWVIWAQVDRIVRAEGRIIAAGRAQVVQHLEGGIVSEILVREGQHVSEGQALMRLSAINASSNLQQGQARLQALKASRARLQAEAQGDPVLRFDEGISVDLKVLEQKAYAERSARLQSEQSVLRQQLGQRDAEWQEAQGRARHLAQELRLAKEQAQILENLVRKGAASPLEHLEAQSRTERLNTQYNDVTSSLPRLDLAHQEAKARISESLFRFRADARQELNQVTAEIARIETTVDADADRVNRTDVRAPTAGYVNRLFFNSVGGVIKSGEPVLEITPSDGPLAVEVRVRPDDRASLRPGLDTRVMLGAYDYARYGVLEGKVLEVSADTLPDEQGQRYYRLVIQTLPAHGPLANEVILPGMIASADVVVGQRSILSYLISPLLRWSHRALREAR